jgi:crotonobetainyl-CoA:carnitine CoA-transferase CaiB-like acyl-CoA transferase
MTKPLSGIKVFELARVLAGPWAGQLLADLGADVIKVERPGGGDETRAWGPPFVTGRDGNSRDSAYFHATNRGKRSVVADLETGAGRELVHDLARHESAAHLLLDHRIRADGALCGAPCVATRRSPTLGEHTSEVLMELAQGLTQ